MQYVKIERVASVDGSGHFLVEQARELIWEGTGGEAKERAKLIIARNAKPPAQWLRVLNAEGRMT